MGRATNRPFDRLDERRLYQFCAEIAQILSVNALDMFYGQATAEGKADILEIFSDRTVRLNRRRQSLLVTSLMMNRGRSPVSRRKTAVLMQARCGISPVPLSPSFANQPCDFGHADQHVGFQLSRP